jgi:hypothetical protein
MEQNLKIIPFSVGQAMAPPSGQRSKAQQSENRCNDEQEVRYLSVRAKVGPGSSNTLDSQRSHHTHLSIAVLVEKGT